MSDVFIFTKGIMIQKSIYVMKILTLKVKQRNIIQQTVTLVGKLSFMMKLRTRTTTIKTMVIDDSS